MRVFLALMLIIAAFPVHAQSIPGTPAPGQAVIREPTDAETAEARVIFENCQTQQVMRENFDCKCVGVNYLQGRILRGPLADKYQLERDSQKGCVDTAQVAGKHFDRCLSWAIGFRNDYARFCSCYANAIARSMAEKPTLTYASRDNMMTAALSQCNITGDLRRREQQRKAVENLKDRGVYEDLFPGARKPVTPDQTP